VGDVLTRLGEFVDYGIKMMDIHGHYLWVFTRRSCLKQEEGYLLEGKKE